MLFRYCYYRPGYCYYAGLLSITLLYIIYTVAAEITNIVKFSLLTLLHGHKQDLGNAL